MSGGWTFGPVERRELPRVKLTPKQRAENANATLKHKAVCAELDKVMEETERRVEMLGGSLRTDDYDNSFYPELILPHDPDSYDMARFTDADMAYFQYIHRNWFGGMSVEIGLALLEAGLVCGWQFTGMSAGRPAKDWPELPWWAKSDKYKDRVVPNPGGII